VAGAGNLSIPKARDDAASMGAGCGKCSELSFSRMSNQNGQLVIHVNFCATANRKVIYVADQHLAASNDFHVIPTRRRESGLGDLWRRSAGGECDGRCGG
jgi:hypothetical protein